MQWLLPARPYIDEHTQTYKYLVDLNQPIKYERRADRQTHKRILKLKVYFAKEHIAARSSSAHYFMSFYVQIKKTHKHTHY